MTGSEGSLVQSSSFANGKVVDNAKTTVCCSDRAAKALGTLGGKKVFVKSWFVSLMFS